jgi:hypothetical protein
MLGMNSASPGSSLGHSARAPALRQSAGSVEIGLVEVDQADRLAGRREVQRADVQVRQLLGREQREAAPARRHAGEVVRRVVVGGDARAVADPDRWPALAVAQVDVVLGAEARQAGVDRGGADIDRRRRSSSRCAASSASTPSSGACTGR